MQKTIFVPIIMVIWTISVISFAMKTGAEESREVQSDFRTRVQEDWARQESHLDRTIASASATTDLISRLERLTVCLEEEALVEPEKLNLLKEKISSTKALDLEKMSESELFDSYCELRWLARDIIFSNELMKDTPLVFMKGNRFGFQILQEYLSYYARKANIHGGGLFILEDPGHSFETRSLTEKFPRGVFSTPNLSYDGKTLYFSFADFSKVQDVNAPVLTAFDLRNKGEAKDIQNYLKEEEGKYHIFKLDLTSGETVQLTNGPYDDFDANLLPDNTLVFLSTRRGGFARCNQSWEPITVATLYQRKQDGTIKCLSWHETNEWTPSVLYDGRIVYTRWDYVDRSASRYQGLWLTNPDGTGAVSLFGNYTEDICACIQPEPVPNSKKIMFVATGHHLAVGGSLVLLDPTKVKYDPKTGFDLFDSLERITPEIAFPETKLEGGGPNDYHIPEQYYYGPYPLSEDFYLVSYSHEMCGGYLPTHGNLTPETVGSGKLGLYYRDRFGNLELMYDDAEYSCRYPLLMKDREVPAEIPSQLADESSDSGTFTLFNVNESLWPFPSNRKIKELRIYQILPKFPSHIGHNPQVGHDFAGNARLFLGTVPVEEDGSAYFTAPARKPLYFQAVDEQGKAVQTMLSEVYLQPGENRGCVGCHEQAQTTFPNASDRIMAPLRAPSNMTPGPEGTNPFSYPILVQPILDRACIACHNDREGSVKPSLAGDNNGHFSVSYNNLKPYLRWYEWIDATIRRTVSLPGECGADMSRLTSILEDEHHKGKMELSEQDRRTLYFWLDSNIPFYGVYDEAVQREQQAGRAVPVPELQ
ncbi:MAG: hypothetical protein Q4G68_11700 [Planctomycetia bacterium]|nr:hypothetical protein [Planctomycetia bacterium]